MTTIEIRELPLVEKFRLMEALWEEMRGRVEAMAVPDEHRRLLDERREHAGSGVTTMLDWDKVKYNIGRR